MSFSKLSFTNAGRALQAKALAGTPLVFTKIALGSGSLNGRDPATFTSLLESKVSISISKTTREGQQVTLEANFSNQDNNTGFYWREVGLFANDPTLGEILYCYGNAGNVAEYIQPSTSSSIEKVITLTAVVGNAQNVTAIINTAAFATKKDISAMTMSLSEVNSKLAQTAKQVDLEVERQRINSFTTLAEGSTTGDAELIDARVDSRGFTHASVGNSTRNIENILNNGFSEVSFADWELGTISSGDGTNLTSATRIRTNIHYIGVGKEVTFNPQVGYNVTVYSFSEEQDYVTWITHESKTVTITEYPYARFVIAKTDGTNITVEDKARVLITIKTHLYDLEDYKLSGLPIRKAIFENNIFSKSECEHKYSGGYDTVTKTPIWVTNLVYSAKYYTILVPVIQYGSVEFSKPINGFQLYLLDTNKNVIANVANSSLNGIYPFTVLAKSLTVYDNYCVLDCTKIPEETKYISITYFEDGIDSNYINYNDAYVPNWFSQSKIIKETVDKVKPKTFEVTKPPYIPVCTGIQQNIYFENLVNAQMNKYMAVNCPNSTGYNDVSQFEVADGKANYSIYLNFYNDSIYEYDTVTIPIKCVPSSAGIGLTKKILFIGDSMTQSGRYASELMAMMETDVMDIELLGTQGITPNVHEGRNGWRAYTYTHFAETVIDDNEGSATVNPFWNPSTSAFDFSHYMSQQAYMDVDYVFINLGTNDKSRGIATDDASVLADWETMVASIHAYNPSVKIILWLCPPPCLLNGKGQVAAAIKNGKAMRDLLISNFAGRENSNIYLCPVYLNVDPMNDFKTSEVTISSRNNMTRTICTDTTHPDVTGYGKIADSIYSMIKYLATL